MPSTTPKWSGATAPGRERTGRRSRPPTALGVVTLVDFAQQLQDLGLVALDLVQAVVGAPVAVDPALDLELAAPGRHVGVHVAKFVQDRALGLGIRADEEAGRQRGIRSRRPVRLWSTSAPTEPASAATIRYCRAIGGRRGLTARRRAQQRASHARPHLGLAAAVVEGAGRVIHRGLDGRARHRAAGEQQHRDEEGEAHARRTPRPTGNERPPRPLPVSPLLGSNSRRAQL